MSVTEDEVERGLLHNGRAARQSLCVLRTIEGAEAALATENTAAAYVDAEWAPAPPRQSGAPGPPGLLLGFLSRAKP